LKVPDVARTLQVTERTVYAWFSGKTAVPYAAYRLLRIMSRFELPGWPGWHMHSGKLWTPEGFGFEPVDGMYWAGLVRRARLFNVLYRENCQLERRIAEAGKLATHAVGVARAARGLVSVSTSCRGGAD